MLRHYLACQVQAQSCALALAALFVTYAVELVEDPLLFTIRDAGAFVCHTYYCSAIFVARQRYADGLILGRVFNGILNKVVDGDTQHCFVAGALAAACHILFKLAVVTTGKVRDHIFHHAGKAERLHGGFVLPPFYLRREQQVVAQVVQPVRFSDTAVYEQVALFLV